METGKSKNSESMTEQEYSPYCPICTGCGEEGCCSPLGCTMDKDGTYCESNLKDLKYGYRMYKELMKLFYDDNKEQIDKIISKVWDEVYTQKQ